MMLRIFVTGFVNANQHTDRYMLETVGNPVAVNPDKKLLRYAKNNKWNVFNNINHD
jgi:phosphoserine phosphatase